jgi:hypothetical protein
MMPVFWNTGKISMSKKYVRQNRSAACVRAVSKLPIVQSMPSEKMKTHSPKFRLLSILAIWLLLILGCRSGARAPSSSPTSSGAPQSNSGSYSSSDDCAAMKRRIDELNDLITQNERRRDEAIERQKEACPEGSSVDCGYWTGVGQGASRNLRDFRQEQNGLQIRLHRSGCD